MIKTKLTTTAILELNEQELRALDALVGYGIEPFLLVFYEKLGRSYLSPHEEGLRNLFKTIKKSVPAALIKAKELLKELN